MESWGIGKLEEREKEEGLAGSKAVRTQRTFVNKLLVLEEHGFSAPKYRDTKRADAVGKNGADRLAGCRVAT